MAVRALFDFPVPLADATHEWPTTMLAGAFALVERHSFAALDLVSVHVPVPEISCLVSGFDIVACLAD